MINLPKNWFAQEFYKLLRKRVRGPISKSRRTMCTISERVPREVFEELVSRMKTDDTSGLKWSEDGKLLPTKRTAHGIRYEGTITKPMATDRLFSLERADLRGVRAKEGTGAWKRSLGCASLKLPDSAKGRLASVFSMVGGNVTFYATVPNGWKSWPRVTLKFFVLTVDCRGNILWPTKWSEASTKLLKEMARRKVEAFLADDAYPIRPDFNTSPGQSSSVLTKESAAPALPPPTQA